MIGIAVLAIGLWLANTSLFADTTAHRTKLIAHRGVHHVYAGTDRSNDACHAAPVEPIEHSLIQNTIPSMREAFRLGAHAVEIDVHPTTDGRFAVFHDWTLDCQTNGSGVTRERTMGELKALDVGYRIDDGSGTFPLRGKGVGALPSLREVLDAELPGPVLVNFKSRDAEEGRAFARALNEADVRSVILQSTILGVYGGGPPAQTALDALPNLRGYTRGSVRRCLVRYLALGWSGYVPASCRDTLVAVPIDYSPYLWGWPHRFTSRMRRAGTEVIVLGPLDATGFSSGIDDADMLARVPAHFDGFVWTNRIDVIGPVARTGR